MSAITSCGESGYAGKCASSEDVSLIKYKKWISSIGGRAVLIDTRQRFDRFSRWVYNCSRTS